MARWKFIAGQAFKSYGSDRCSSFAAAIAYYTLLSIFPLAVFAVAIAGFILKGDAGAQERIINALLNNLPLSQESGRQSLHDTLNSVTNGSGGLGLVGALGAAYSASALFGALRTALGAIFHVERERPVVQTKLLDLGMTIGLGLLLILSLGLTAAIALAQKFAADLFGSDVAGLAKVLLTLAYFVLPPLVSMGIFMIAYKIIPHAELNWRDTIPGALFAAIAFEVLKLGFAFYVANIRNFDAVYGTLGFVIAFLFFAYLTSQVILLGAEFTRAYVEVKSGTIPSAAPAVPKRPMSLGQRLVAMVKGLFVAPEPHHDQSLPYQPAKKAGRLTDEQAKQQR